MAGFSDKEVEEYCIRAVAVLEKYFQKVNPGFKFWLSTWDALNSLCDEEVIQKK